MINSRGPELEDEDANDETRGSGCSLGSRRDQEAVCTEDQVDAVKAD